jgi:hypothetical protein
MYFLIDYENVNNAGMRGTEFLQPEDCVLVFYSASAHSMEQRHLSNIKVSGCGFETYKLTKKRKNGLDFYIATKVGELFGAGRCQKAVVVSNDTGFQAVREFWQDRSGTKNRVTLSPSIEQGIVASGESSERARKIQSARKTVDIGNFYAAYQESQKLQRMLAAAFGDTAFADRLEEIEGILGPGRSPKVIYLDSLRHFGRKDGQAIYRILKGCASD